MTEEFLDLINNPTYYMCAFTLLVALLGALLGFRFNIVMQRHGRYLVAKHEFFSILVLLAERYQIYAKDEPGERAGKFFSSVCKSRGMLSLVDRDGDLSTKESIIQELHYLALCYHYHLPCWKRGKFIRTWREIRETIEKAWLAPDVDATEDDSDEQAFQAVGTKLDCLYKLVGFKIPF